MLTLRLVLAVIPIRTRLAHPLPAPDVAVAVDRIVTAEVAVGEEEVVKARPALTLHLPTSNLPKTRRIATASTAIRRDTSPGTALIRPRRPLTKLRRSARRVLMRYIISAMADKLRPTPRSTAQSLIPLIARRETIYPKSNQLPLRESVAKEKE